MFAYNSEGGDAIFNDMNQLLNRDNTMSIYVSSEGNIGPKVSINKALLFCFECYGTNKTSVKWMMLKINNAAARWS